MTNRQVEPEIYRMLRRQARNVRKSPTGDVGLAYRGSGIEAVWVEKKGERIHRRWFQPDTVDLLLVIRGKLKVEFEDRRFRTRVLTPGDLLVLPPKIKCRAYRWPRSSRTGTVFFAVYPMHRT